MNKIIFLLLLCLCSSLFNAPLAQASTLRVESKSDILQTEDTFTAQVFLDTQGEQINAVEATIGFSQDIFELVEILDGSSDITFWAKKPEAHDGNQISFSGIIPGGVKGRDVELLQLQFKVKKEGVGKVFFENVQTLINDGLGTPSEVSTAPFAINILGQAQVTPVVTQYVDTEPPEQFAPVITSDPDIFDGNKMLIFATEDKGSGVDFYEVKEGEFGGYEKATSPYELKDQTVTQKIFIRAVDFEGNEFVATLFPQNPPAWYQLSIVKTIALILGTVSFLLFFRRFLTSRSS